LRARLVINPKRESSGKAAAILQWAVDTGAFSHAYIDGGFITTKPSPKTST